MAVIRCPHCKQYISSNLKVCTECGKPLGEEVKTSEVTEGKETETRHEPSGESGKVKKWYSPTARKIRLACVLLPFVALGTYLVIDDISRQHQLEERAYARLEASNDLLVYEDFLLRFPDSKHKDEVQKRYETLKVELSTFYREAAQGDRQALLDFIAQHPTSPYRKNCEMRLDSLDWQDAQALNTLEAYQAYIAQHPRGIFISDAQEGKSRQARLVVSAEESSLIRGSLDGFLAAMTSRDSLRINQLTGGRFDFCGLTDVSGSAVVDYYNQALHKEDVLGVHFQVAGLSVSKRFEGGTDRMSYSVRSEAVATINRSSMDSAMVVNYHLSANFTPEKQISSLSLTQDAE